MISSGAASSTNPYRSRTVARSSHNSFGVEVHATAGEGAAQDQADHSIVGSKVSDGALQKIAVFREQIQARNVIYSHRNASTPPTARW